jgi:hypothetical protein
MPRLTDIQLRRGTATEWISVNPILDAGEPGFELDTNKFKIGDGVTPWNLLKYQSGEQGAFGGEGLTYNDLLSGPYAYDAGMLDGSFSLYGDWGINPNPSDFLTNLTPVSKVYVSANAYSSFLYNFPQQSTVEGIVDVTKILNYATSSTSNIKGHIKITSLVDPKFWIILAITGAPTIHTPSSPTPGYSANVYEIPVTFLVASDAALNIASNPNIYNDANGAPSPINVSFSVSGDAANVNSPTSYTPTWSTSSGTGLSYTGTPTTGSYVKIGKLVFFKIKVIFTTVNTFGTAQYRLTLPWAPDGDYVFRDGGLHQGSVHYAITGDAAAGTTTLNLYHFQNTNGSNSYVYDDPFTGTNPVTLTTAGYMYLSGSYLTA